MPATIILRPYPHFTRHVCKKICKTIRILHVRKSADPQICILPEAPKNCIKFVNINIYYFLRYCTITQLNSTSINGRRCEHLFVCISMSLLYNYVSVITFTDLSAPVRTHRIGLFCVLCFQRAACRRFQTCILKSH